MLEKINFFTKQTLPLQEGNPAKVLVFQTFKKCLGLTNLGPFSKTKKRPAQTQKKPNKTNLFPKSFFGFWAETSSLSIKNAPWLNKKNALQAPFAFGSSGLKNSPTFLPKWSPSLKNRNINRPTLFLILKKEWWTHLTGGKQKKRETSSRGFSVTQKAKFEIRINLNKSPPGQWPKEKKNHP